MAQLRKAVCGDQGITTIQIKMKVSERMSRALAGR
jgi:hypothetical protein